MRRRGWSIARWSGPEIVEGWWCSRSNNFPSTVGVPAGANPDGKGPPTLLVPGDPESSALIYRMRSRTAQVAMPPLGSNVVDEHGVETVSEFIRTLK
ncbi:MAG: c-type cytochrome domain-containing protein [Myxococcales bacterium]